MRVRNVANFALAENGTAFYGFVTRRLVHRKTTRLVCVLQLTYRSREHADIIELELDCSPALRENPVR